MEVPIAFAVGVLQGFLLGAWELHKTRREDFARMLGYLRELSGQKP